MILIFQPAQLFFPTTVSLFFIFVQLLPFNGLEGPNRDHQLFALNKQTNTYRFCEKTLFLIVLRKYDCQPQFLLLATHTHTHLAQRV